MERKRKVKKMSMSKDKRVIEEYNESLRVLEKEVDRVVEVLVRNGWYMDEEIVGLIKMEEIEYGVESWNVEYIVINGIDSRDGFGRDGVESIGDDGDVIDDELREMMRRFWLVRLEEEFERKVKEINEIVEKYKKMGYEEEEVREILYNEIEK